jgi:hypothetical protein
MKFNPRIMSAAVATALASHPRRRIYTRDGITFDQATRDSAGAFLVGELERLDQELHMPLVQYTWSRDIDLREDVTLADETSSYTNSTFASANGVQGSNISWIGKNGEVKTGMSLDIGKTPNPLNLWGQELGWTLPELASAQKLGRPVDSQKYEGMQLKYNMDIDQLVYIGDSAIGTTGLLNHTLMTNTGNSVNSGTGTWSALITANATTAPDLILQDINELLKDVWVKSGYAVTPERLLLAPGPYATLVTQKVSSAGNISILNYVRENSIATANNNKPLEILPCKWLTGTNNSGQGPGAAGKDSMLAYTKQKRLVRYPLVPLQRTPIEFRGISQLVNYYGRLGAVELVYPETMGRRDGIG